MPPTGTPQTTYSLNNPGALPGMIWDSGIDVLIDSRPCGAVALDQGVVVELVNGLLVIAQGTGDPDSNNVWGVTVMKTANEPGQYQPGDQVPVMRRGRIAGKLAVGISSFVEGAPAKFTHSSTSNSKGLFTTAAVSGTAGSEISTGPFTFFKDVGLAGATPNSLAIIEVNLP